MWRDEEMDGRPTSVCALADFAITLPHTCRMPHASCRMRPSSSLTAFPLCQVRPSLRGSSSEAQAVTAYFGEMTVGGRKQSVLRAAPSGLPVHRADPSGQAVAPWSPP